MRGALACLAGVAVGFLLGYLVGSWFLSAARMPTGEAYDGLEVRVFGLFGGMCGALLGGSVGALAARD